MTTQRTFEAVAAVIRAEVETIPLYDVPMVQGTAVAVVERFASALCGVFAADNPRFNRRLFLSACGLGE